MHSFLHNSLKTLTFHYASSNKSLNKEEISIHPVLLIVVAKYFLILKKNNSERAAPSTLWYWYIQAGESMYSAQGLEHTID